MNQVYIQPQTLELLRSQGLLDFSTGVMQVPQEAYDALKKGILEANGYWNYSTNTVTNMNGYLILPVLSGVALFLQQKFNPAMANGGMGMNMAAAGNSEEQAQAQGCTNKMMMWLMPIFSVYICATGNTAFALYWFVSSLYAFGQMRVVDLIKKRKAKKQEVIIS